MSIATIDIGTNTVLLLIAERREQKWMSIFEAATITRLGRGVDRTRELHPESVADTLACLDHYATLIAEHHVERTLVVGTSAMRDAKGGEVIRDFIRKRLGVEARVISGDEEALLTFRGGISGLTLKSEQVAVFDVGGGSTEVVLGDEGRIVFRTSVNIGSVRLTERHVRSDPPSPGEWSAIQTDVQSALASGLANLPPIPKGTSIVGIAGTVTTLAAVHLEMAEYEPSRIHGVVISREALSNTVDRLRAMPNEARKILPGLEPKRADVIVAGGACVIGVMGALGAEHIVVSDRGVRWGLLDAY